MRARRYGVLGDGKDRRRLDWGRVRGMLCVDPRACFYPLQGLMADLHRDPGAAVILGQEGAPCPEIPTPDREVAEKDWFHVACSWYCWIEEKESRLWGLVSAARQREEAKRAQGAGGEGGKGAPVIPPPPAGYQWTSLERAILATLRYEGYTLDTLAGWVDEGTAKTRPRIGWKDERERKEWSYEAIRKALLPASRLRTSRAVAWQRGVGYFRPDAPPGQRPSQNISSE